MSLYKYETDYNKKSSYYPYIQEFIIKFIFQINGDG